MRRWEEFKKKFNKKYNSPAEEAQKKGELHAQFESHRGDEQESIVVFTIIRRIVTGFRIAICRRWLTGARYKLSRNKLKVDFKMRNTALTPAHKKSMKQRAKPGPQISAIYDKKEWDVPERGCCHRSEEPRYRRISYIIPKVSAVRAGPFPTVANVEGANFVQNKILEDLSEQELVDCDETDHGCNGGLPESADQWIIAQNMGLEKESDYPYTGEEGDCKADPKRERVFVHNVLEVSTVEDEIARALVKYGPLAVLSY